jgi:Zn-dependent protease
MIFLNTDWRDATSVQFLIAYLLMVAVAITIHELAHALRAYIAGDDTAKRQGRISLNPIDHYDPIGSTCILLFGFGWAKPVPVNPLRFRHYRRDMFMVAWWGPLSNFVLAVIFATLYRLFCQPGGPGANTPFEILLYVGIMINLFLGLFNLLPVVPLDGSKMLSAFLNMRQARSYDNFMMQYGMIALLLVFMLGGRLVAPVASGIMRILIG